jgi:tetratricopeptide (TPR) repeat protein
MRPPRSRLWMSPVATAVVAVRAIRVRRVLWAALIAAGALGLWSARSRLFPDPLAAGRAAYERRAWGIAAAEARKRLKDRPDDRAAWQLLARAEGRQGRDAAAQAIYRRRLGLDTMTAEDFVIAASGLLRGGQAKQARLALEKARAREPDHPEMLHELARLDAATDRLAEAADLAGRLVARPGWEVRGWLVLGQVREALEDPAGTAEALQQALRLDPTLAAADSSVGGLRKRLARAWLRAGRPAEARESLAAVLAGGGDPEAAWLLGRALLQEGDIPAAKAALARSEGYGDADPTRPEPAPFVGAARCAECHPSLHRNQQSSRHARTFHRGTEPEALPALDRPAPDPADARVRHVLRREGGRPRWETTDGDRALRALVEYAFGSGGMAVTMVGWDEAGVACELRLTHYGRGAGWDVTTGQPIHPPSRRQFLGRPLGPDGVRRCLGCHTTNFRIARERSGPAAADRGIGCERCHGPGGHHLRAIAGRFPEPAIARPRLATAEQVMALCATCHSPKELVLSPGDRLAARFASPSLAWSRCYAESGGRLTCVTCHDPHRDAETSAAFYEAKCLVCHAEEVPGPPARPEDLRRTPCPVDPAKDCLKCHMPAVDEIVPHTKFTDHRIRVHRTVAGSR